MTGCLRCDHSNRLVECFDGAGGDCADRSCRETRPPPMPALMKAMSSRPKRSTTPRDGASHFFSRVASATSVRTSEVRARNRSAGAFQSAGFGVDEADFGAVLGQHSAQA